MMGQYMEQARMLAAQCWCDEETSGKEMDAVLAEAVARRIAAWMETAAQMARNADFYRGLIDECAKYFGDESYTADDGSVMDSPVRLKLPELISKLKQERDEAVALTEVMRNALECFKRWAFDETIPTREAVEQATDALSITPSAAMREIQARTLEEAALLLWEDKDTAEWLVSRAAAKRNGE